MMTLSREAIQRMVGGKAGTIIGGGGGISMSMLAGYATEAWVNQNYLSIGFFSSLFKAYTNEGVEVLPNGGDRTTIENVKAMFGFWTEQYVSALGKNSDGGGGTVSSLEDLSDVNITSPTTGQVLTWNGTAWVNQAGGSGSGSVTSVGMSVPTGFTVSGSPVTSSGTLALRFASGYSLPTTAKQAHWDTAYGWGDHAQAGYLTEHQSLAAYATKTWVQQQGYLTSHQSLAGYATQQWVQNQGYLTEHQRVYGTFWGKSWENGETVNGSISAGSSGGSINQFHAIELNSAGSLSNLGGYIDFHFNGSSADYTSRIIEQSSGVLTVVASGDATGLRIGTGSYADYVQVGNVRLTYDATNNALKVERQDGTAANLYATGALSALGMSPGTGSIDEMTFGNITVNSRVSVGGFISGPSWEIPSTGFARFTRVYLDSVRYLFIEGTHLYYYNGNQSIQLD